MLELERLLLMHSIDVHARADLEGGVELHRHAQSAEHHVSVAVLGPEGLVSDFQTWRAVDGAVNPGHLGGLEHMVCSISWESVGTRIGQAQWQSCNLPTNHYKHRVLLDDTGPVTAL